MSPNQFRVGQRADRSPEAAAEVGSGFSLLKERKLESAFPILLLRVVHTVIGPSIDPDRGVKENSMRCGVPESSPSRCPGNSPTNCPVSHRGLTTRTQG